MNFATHKAQGPNIPIQTVHPALLGDKQGYELPAGTPKAESRGHSPECAGSSPVQQASFQRGGAYYALTTTVMRTPMQSKQDSLSAIKRSGVGRWLMSLASPIRPRNIRGHPDFYSGLSAFGDLIMKDGGPAFPCERRGYNSETHEEYFEGISVRDYFAAAALTGFLGNSTIEIASQEGRSDSELLAEAIFVIADAMIAAREES